MKILLRIIPLLLMALMLTGCWGYREVDEQAYVLALGVDKGEENVLKLTAQIAVPKNIAGGEGGGGGGSGEEPAMVVSVETATILGGLNMMSPFLERRPTLKHTKAIVFSSELAREDMGRYLAPLVRFPEFRRNTFIIISREKAAKIIKDTQPILENNPSKYMELAINTHRYTSFFPASQVHSFYNSAKSNASAPVAILAGTERKNKGGDNSGNKSGGAFLPGEIPREGGNKVEMIGAAVFRGGKMIGEINGDEVSILEMIRGNFRERIYTVTDPGEPGKYIILKLYSERKPDIDVFFREGMPVINAEVSLDAEFISIQSNINYERPEAIKEIEIVTAKKLEKESSELIKKTQDEFRADIFGLGIYMKKYFMTWGEWEQFDWSNVYPDTEVNVNYKVNIRRIGLLRESSSIREE